MGFPPPPEPTPPENKYKYPEDPYCPPDDHFPVCCYEKTGDKITNYTTLSLLIVNTVLLLIIFGMLLGK